MISPQRQPSRPALGLIAVIFLSTSLLATSCTIATSQRGDVAAAEPGARTDTGPEHGEVAGIVLGEDAPFQLGDFDPEDPNISLFDPCSEIPREVLDQVGLGKELDYSLHTPLQHFCSYRPVGFDPQPLIVTLDTNYRTEEELEQEGKLVKSSTESPNPGIHYVDQSINSVVDCGTGISTNRGRFVVSVSAQPFSELPIEVVCDQSAQTMKDLLTLIGGNQWISESTLTL